MTEMRASLIVTADARSVVVESRAAADGLRALRQEAATAGSGMAGLAANSDRAVTATDKVARAQTNAATAMKSAEASASVFSAALDREQAAMVALQGALDPGIRAMREFEATQQQITQAVLTGTMAEADAARVLQQLTDRYDAFAAAQSRAKPSKGSAAASAAVFESAGVYDAFERELATDAARSFQSLEESLNPVIRAEREFAQAQEAVNRALATGGTTAIQAARTMQQLEQRLDAVVRAQSPAYQSAMAIERALEEEERAVRALMLSLDPAGRAAAEFARDQQLINRAVAQGTITQEQAVRSLAQLEAQQQVAARGGQSMAMGVQNASFQMTDFIVQVQGGQSASLALAQQLPQLLGGFGALGAVMGLAVAAGVPLATMWLSSEDAAGTLDERLGRLEERLSSVTDRLRILRDERLEETFGSMTGDIRTMTTLLLELDRAAELKNLRNTVNQISDEQVKPGFWQRALRANIDQNRSETEGDLRRENFAELTGGRGLSYDDFTARRSEIDTLAQSGQVQAVVDRVEALIRDMAAGGPVSEMNSDLQTMLSTLGQVAEQTARVEAEFNGTANASRVWNGIVEGSGEVWARVREQAEAINADAAERTRIAENERAVAEAIFRHGEDSKEVAAERARIARESYEQELVAAGLFEAQRDRLLEIYDQTVSAQDATAGWAARMSDVRAEVEGILSALGSIGGEALNRAAQQAELDALNAGATVADAARAGSSARRQAEYDQRVQGAGPLGQIWAGAQRAWDEAGDRLDDQLSGARTDARERERENRGGGRSSGLGAVSSVRSELARLKPSYDADLAAADAWREKALAGLKETNAGYDRFARDVEAVYQEKLAQAYEDDLKRRDDWAAGVERAFLEIEDSAMSWAELSEGLVTGWAEGAEQAFVRFATTGKAELSDLANFAAEMFAKMAFQQTLQPGLNSLLDLGVSAVSGYFGSAAPATSVRPVTRTSAIRTNHTGSPGVMRSYALGGDGDSMRQDEHLTMMRRGEEILTSRALENAGALISAMTALAARPSDSGQIDARPIIQVQNTSSAQVQAELTETTDSRGRKQYALALSDAVATGLSAPGGKARKTMSQQYGMRRPGINR